MNTLGIVGLGHMGGNIAARFLGAGYTVYGEALDRHEAHDLECKGLDWRDTPANRRGRRHPRHVPPGRRRA